MLFRSAWRTKRLPRREPLQPQVPIAGEVAAVSEVSAAGLSLGTLQGKDERYAARIRVPVSAAQAGTHLAEGSPRFGGPTAEDLRSRRAWTNGFRRLASLVPEVHERGVASWCARAEQRAP